MKPVIFHRKARAELDQAMAYYEKRSEGLGLDLLSAVEEAILRIRQNPRLCSWYKQTGFRKRLVDRFPFLIFYRELEESIWIAAVAHAKRRPDYWIRRTPE